MTATDPKRLCKTSGGASCCPSACLDGIEATKRILKERPTTVAVGISVDQAEHVMYAMEDAGAVAFLTKESAVNQLYETIGAAMNGKVVMWPA